MTLQAAPLFDKLVFSKVKTRLGGRVKLILTGGAPLARHVEDFLKVTMCCPVVQVSWHPRVTTDVSLEDIVAAAGAAVCRPVVLPMVVRSRTECSSLSWQSTVFCPVARAMASQKRAPRPSLASPTRSCALALFSSGYPFTRPVASQLLLCAATHAALVKEMCRWIALLDVLLPPQLCKLVSRSFCCRTMRELWAHQCHASACAWSPCQR